MDILFVIIISFVLNSYLINRISNRFVNVATSYLWILFVIHIFLTCIYFLYAANSTSDSVSYFNVSSNSYEWFSHFNTGTSFIHFLAWPFTSFFGFSYYAVMLLFSLFGYWGIMLFYLVIKENVLLDNSVGNFSPIELVFLLPNLHFWTSSLGKGSSIMFGLGLFTYGLSRFNLRYKSLALGGFIVFMIRPHIFFAAILSIMLGLLFTQLAIKKYLRWVIFFVALILFLLTSDDVMKMADSDSLNIFNSTSIAHRASELSKAKSGVNIEEYGLPLKLFTFWFRPLFFDGMGIVGLIASFENLIYLIMLFYIIKGAFLNWTEWNGFFRICFFIFFFASIALAQVTGNLGIAMRQKAQLMPFFLIVFCKAFSYKNLLYENRE